MHRIVLRLEKLILGICLSKNPRERLSPVKAFWANFKPQPKPHFGAHFGYILTQKFQNNVFLKKII